MLETIRVATSGKGLYEFTQSVSAVVSRSGLAEAVCQLFIRHTSASLTIQENADPAVLSDLTRWFERLVPEHDPLYTHIQEGGDDMPAHIRSALTDTSLSIPVQDSRLLLGTWQGIYVFEHRIRPHTREVVVQVIDTGRSSSS